MSPITQFLATLPTVEDVRQKIEALRADIRILEVYCNARFLVVSQLPTEILTIIFEHVALSEPDTIRHLFARPYAGWLPVSQVCRWWRNVAVNSPRIWGSIYMNSKLELARLFLERSKSAPLHIKSNYYTYKLDIVDLWFSQGHRLRTIELKFPTLAGWMPLFKALKAPNLESLTLRISSNMNFEFATEIDADHAPLLRVVDLHDCYFDLRTSYVSQVRSLTIRYNAYGSGHRPMLEIMLALKEMKPLEYLEIVDLLTFSDEIPSDLLIDLPNLKELNLKCTDPRVLLMLQNLACANIQSIIADAAEPVESGELANRIAAAFRSILPNTSSSTWLKVYYKDSDDPALAIIVSVEQDAETDTDTEVPSPKSAQISQLKLAGPMDYSAHVALMPALLELPPKSLDIYLRQGWSQPPAYDREGLFAFMRTLDCVEELITPTVQDLLVIISDVPNQTQVNEARRGTILPFSLPSLKRIDVTQFTQKEPGDQTFDNLQKALERRRNIDAGIEVLRLNPWFRKVEQQVEILKSEVQLLEYLNDN